MKATRARFLDTNVLLRYLTRDDEAKGKEALALLLRVERGEEKVITSSLVVFETIFTLQRYYKVSRESIREMLAPIISLRGLILSDKQIIRKALELFTSSNVSFADSYNVVFMETKKVREIYSWDYDFDKIDGVIRLEPGQEPAISGGTLHEESTGYLG